MRSNGKFIKNWEKDRQKGKIKYITSGALMYSAVYWISTVIIDLIRGYRFSNLSAHVDLFIAIFIGASVGMYLNWYKNENKYNEIKRD